MMRRVLLAALAAGLAVGVLVTALQAFTTTPLILAAEVYEAAGGGEAHGHAHDDGHAHDGDGAFPGGEVDRLVSTLLANVVTSVGFALLLVAGFALSGRHVDERQGLLWGLAGFAVFALAPAAGLPPELPGTMAAELADRQAWWLFAAGGAAVGLWLIVFWRNRFGIPLGLAAALLPHVVGAPAPEAMGGSAPPELAAEFAALAIAVQAVFWAMLGWIAGGLYRRFG